MRTFLGPNTIPPCRQSGERIEPARARPVPFCFHGLRFVKATSERPLQATVPCCQFFAKARIHVENEAEDLQPHVAKKHKKTLHGETKTIAASDNKKTKKTTKDRLGRVRVRPQSLTSDSKQVIQNQWLEASELHNLGW